MNKVIILLFLMLSLPSIAQQDAIFSQYTFNPLVINPAYAGARSSFSAVLFHRSQWVGINNAPTTQSFSVHSPVNNSKLAFGLNMSNETIGPSRNLNVAFSTAYHIKLKKAKLSLALRAGVFNSVLNKNLLKFKDNTDIFNEGGIASSTVPSFDFGLYYYKTKFFMGLSISHLSKHRFSFFDAIESNGSSTDYFLRTHIFINGGYVFEISKNFAFKPTFLLKASEGANPNLDINFNALFYKKLWLGIAFRNKTSVNFLINYNMTDYLRIGYAYDVSINKLSGYNNGSHEIFLGFDFNFKSKKVISPRYL